MPYWTSATSATHWRPHRLESGRYDYRGCIIQRTRTGRWHIHPYDAPARLLGTLHRTLRQACAHIDGTR